MTHLFISDLHLEAARPEIAKQFLDFMETEAISAEALYILGDLFESWIGDDDPNSHYVEIKNALRVLVEHKVPVYFMHGNRDFMIGEGFLGETGANLLPDPYILEIHGTRVLLCHGDAMCTDDLEYQAMRKMTRDPRWQAEMLRRPLAERQAIAAQARAASLAHNRAIDDTITDVNAAAVVACFRSNGVKTMLHGHTHRPAVHKLTIDGESATRIVLGDWYTHASIVRWDKNGPVLSAMQR